MAITDDQQFALDLFQAMVFRDMFPGVDEAAQCLRHAIAGAVACHRFGLRAVVQAGSAGVLYREAESEFLEWRWKDVEFETWTEDWLPEMHVWLGVGDKDGVQWVWDPSMRWIKETLAACDRTLQAPEPACWNRIGTESSTLWYAAEPKAIDFAIKQAKSMLDKIREARSVKQ